MLKTLLCQEPIDPTTGERPPLVQPAGSGPEGTPPGSRFTASPTASVEMHHRKLEQRRSFLDRAKRFSWGSHQDASTARAAPSSERGSRPPSPELFFSPTGDDGERHIMTSPLVPMRARGHQRNQSLPPEVEQAHIERPALSHTRKSLSIESRLPETAGGAAVAESFDPQDGLGHRHWMALELERAKKAEGADQWNGPGIKLPAPGGPAFEGPQVLDPASGGETDLRVPVDNVSRQEAPGPRALPPLRRSVVPLKAAVVDVLQSVKPKGGIAEISGREMERRVVERQLAPEARAEAELAVDGGQQNGGREQPALTEVPSASRDSDVLALSGPSSRMEGASAKSGKGILAAALGRLKVRKRKRRKDEQGVSHGALMNGTAYEAAQLSGLQSGALVGADGEPTSAVAEAQLQGLQLLDDPANEKPHLEAFGSEFIQNPPVDDFDGEIARPVLDFGVPEQRPRGESQATESMGSKGWGQERRREQDAGLKEALSPPLQPATPEANGQELAPRWRQETVDDKAGVSDYTDEQSEGGGELVRWGENGLFSNGHIGSHSDSSFLDTQDEFPTAPEPSAYASSSRGPTHVRFDSVEGFQKFATAAIAAAAVSNAFAAHRGDRAEHFVQSAAGAAAATFLGGSEIVGETLGAAISRTTHAARSVHHLPVMRTAHSVWGPNEAEDWPEVDPRAQKHSGDSAQGDVHRTSLAAHMRQLSAVEEGEVLGGDLVVRLVSADGLAARREHCNPYCVLEVERQRKRSAIRNHTTAPQWNEELPFKAVRTSADLHVSVFSAERVGRDVFLGEVRPCLGLRFLNVPMLIAMPAAGGNIGNFWS